MNSYSLRQPNANKITSNKRKVKKMNQRHLYVQLLLHAIVIVMYLSLNIIVLNCNASQSLPTELMDNYEIECSDCGCRIFRKSSD